MLQAVVKFLKEKAGYCWREGRWRETVIFFAVPLLAGLFTVMKVFFNPQCRAFDSNDDVLHTFPQLFYAQEAMRSGQLPLMGLFNNFGSPLTGDALTYPFSLQALIYWFIPFEHGMAVARFLTAFVTVLLLTVFFRRWMSRTSASLCALLSFFAPHFIWYTATHHYQLTLAGLAALLICHDRWVSLRRAVDLVVLWGMFVLLFLSVSMNLAVFVSFFLIIYHFIVTGFRWQRSSTGFFLALAGGVAFVLPDLIYMFQSGLLSVRIGRAYPHVSPIQHVFWTPVVLSLVGIAALVKRAEWRPALAVVLLGLCPTALVFLLIHFQQIWHAIPVLRNSDVSRFIWIATPFVMLGMGVCLDFVRQGSRAARAVVFLGLFFFLLELCFFPVYYNFALYRFRPVFWVWGLVILNVMGLALFWTEGWFKAAWFRLFAWLLALAVLFLELHFAVFMVFGYFDMKTCRPDVIYYSDAGADRFHPRQLVGLLKPYTRVAANFPSGLGLEFRLGYDRIFGSAARSIMMNNKPFYDYAHGQGLIADDEGGGSYYFVPPWRKDVLSELGITYVMDRKFDPEALKDGWKLLAYIPEQLYLYQNPVPTSVIYGIDERGARYPMDEQKASFKGNTVDIILPEAASLRSVVAAFIYRPGWKAFVDGKEARLYYGENRLLRVDVPPGAQRVVFFFQPFPLYLRALLFLISIAVPLAFLAAARAGKEFWKEAGPRDKLDAGTGS